MKRFIWGVGCAVLVFTAPLFGIDVKFLDTIDGLYMSRDVSGHLAQSISLLEAEIVKPNISDDHRYACHWRLARSIAYIDDYMEAERSDKLDLYEKGRQYAEQAINLNPKGADGFYWHGVVMGKAAEFRGILESLFAIGPIRDSMTTVVALKSDYARAYFILSRLYRKAPGLISIGNIKTAHDMILKGVAIDPDDIFIQTEYGKVLVALNEHAKAQSVLKQVLEMPIRPTDFKPVMLAQKAEAKELLSQYLD